MEVGLALLSDPPPYFGNDCLTRHFFFCPGVSYYTSSVVVRPEHYEELIHRGWRRYALLIVAVAISLITDCHDTRNLDQASSTTSRTCNGHAVRITR